jgi:CRISPR-associated protein Cst2
MAFVSGLLVLDAPASALNNAGADVGARTDNIVVVKKIRTPQGVYPYVSAQSFRYWLRTTLETAEPDWVTAPVFREAKVAYTDANPVKNWDDDLFGYMRAPSKKADAKKAEHITPLDQGREITRVSPFRVSTFVAIAPSPVVTDYGTMTRHDGDPVPYEHEFYRAHLQGLISLDLTCAGTFFDMERVGYKNLDSHRRKEAVEVGCEPKEVRSQKAIRLPLPERCKRASTLLRGLTALNGGAKQAVHYTDLTPALVFLAVIRNGNNPFYRVLKASKSHQTEFNREAFEEVLKVYKKDFLSEIYIGWAKGFLDEERKALETAIKENTSEVAIHLKHPREAIISLADELADTKNEVWYQ